MKRFVGYVLRFGMVCFCGGDEGFGRFMWIGYKKFDLNENC